jgi:uncharacterized protein
MNILVLCDDRWHPAKTVRAGLAPLEKSGLHFDWIEDANDWSAERMADYPVVILSKSNNVTAANESAWMTESAAQAFVDYVRQGKGLLVIHSGSAGYKEVPALRSLMGGVFDHHPEQCPVTVTPVEGKPMAAGSQPFTCKDEHYFMELDDQNVDVFLKSSSLHGEQPAGWTRQEGNGRVCMLTPGHNLEIWLDPGFQTLIRTAIQWCASSPANTAIVDKEQ